MRPAKPFLYPGIAEETAALGRLLDLALAVDPWSPGPQPAILNLACGRADETGVLLQRLAPHAASGFYLGIDLRHPEIADARSRWLPAAPPGWNLDFRPGDASRTDRMRQLPPFDFIFIRHQNFWHDVPVWTRLFTHALAALKPTGLLAITSYFDREHDLATACLLQLGAEKIADLTNPKSHPVPDAPQKSVDRRLALFRLPAPA